MRLRGYAEPQSLRAGETVAVKASTGAPRYSARLVRLLAGDDRPEGPGLRVAPVGDRAPVTVPGRHQPLPAGSYMRVPDAARLRLEALTVVLWLWPTSEPPGDWEPLVAQAIAGGPGFELGLAAGRPALRLLDGAGEATVEVATAALERRRWRLVAAAVDWPAGRVQLLSAARGPAGAAVAGAGGAGVAAVGGAAAIGPAEVVGGCAGRALAPAEGAPLLFGAVPATGGERGGLDGRIGHPRLYAEAIDLEAPGAVAAVARAADAVAPAAGVPDAGDDGALARWDMAADPSSLRVVDRGRHGLHGELVNMPTRGVTDHLWDGREIDHRHRAGYGAVHFHVDDLEDARWETDVAFDFPPDAPSGVYAAELEAPGATEHVPFFVLPPRGRATADVAVLFPTFTYQAYANERGVLVDDLSGFAWVGDVWRDASTRYPLEEPGLGPSVYDRHADGSPCVHSSRLRPMSTLRPTERYPLLGAPRNLAADLYLVDWLDGEGIAFDALTDEALHAEGAALLAGHRVLITGGHPEYWTAAMLAALDAFVAGGGRVMYLGGNGFYWVTGVHRERPHVIEVRRGVGWRPRDGQRAGEGHLATTGEPSGLWADRGRTPHALVGVGFAAEGRGAPAAGYARAPGSFDPRAAFAFAGIRADETIGEFGLVEGGAAGDELDRADTALGTPEHALVLATSRGRHGDHMRLFDPVLLDEPAQTGAPAGGANPAVRADMVFFETPAGGAVFSVGSISWRGSLSHRGGDNNVARITHNVLERFLDETPFRSPNG